MIATSGALGLDWRALDLSSYLEAVEAHNEMQQASDGKPKATPDQIDRLRRAMNAHGV